MKITNVEVLMTGTAWRNFVFVKLTTDEGLVGWGDGLEWKETAVRELILDYGRRYVVGRILSTSRTSGSSSTRSSTIPDP